VESRSKYNRQSRRLLLPVPQHAIRSLKYCFGLACSGSGQALRRHKQSTFSLVSFCGVDHWVKDSITPLAIPPSRPMQSDHLSWPHAEAPGVPADAFLRIPRPSLAVVSSSFPVDYFLIVVAFQLPGRIFIGLLHNVEFSDPYGFHSLPVIRKQTLCNRSSLSINFRPVNYSLVAALNRLQPLPCPPSCDGPGCRRLHP
jgi:hypothetical protein